MVSGTFYLEEIQINSGEIFRVKQIDYFCGTKPRN